MAGTSPLITIGLPVFNGMPYLPLTLASLLNQTFGDFELLITDNGSQDGTLAVCRDAARRDARVRVFQNRSNLGPAANANQLVDLARGKYFKWAAADDLCDPRFLQACVDALEQHSQAALCYSRFSCIDEHGAAVDDYHRYSEHLLHDTTPRRFLANLRGVHVDVIIFGVMRRELLSQTRRFCFIPETDRVLLAEIALRGEIIEVPETLFYRRLHTRQSSAQHPTRSSYAAWTHLHARGRHFPTWQLLREFATAAWLAPFSLPTRLACLAQLRHWPKADRDEMRREVQHAARQLVARWLPGHDRWLVIRMADVPAERLDGFHAVEKHKGRYFRWAEPRAELLLDLPPADYELVIDSKHLGCCWCGHVRLTINDNWRATAVRQHRGGSVRLNIPQAAFSPSGRQRLGFEFNAIDKPSGDSYDPRNLAAPIVEIRLRRRCSGAGGQSLGGDQTLVQRAA